jgi:hypothetical protein
MRAGPGEPLAAAQTFGVSLEFGDGSLATVVYGARGARGLGKEYVEAHAGGRSAVLDDFRSLTLHDGGKRRRVRSRGADKGHNAQFERLRELLDGSWRPEQPSGLESMAATLAALRSAASGRSSAAAPPPGAGDPTAPTGADGAARG